MSVGVDVQYSIGNMVVIDAVSVRVMAFRNSLMSERFDSWSEMDINLIFIHYIMGIVVCVFANYAPDRQIKIIQYLAELEISQEEAVRALHIVPPGGRGGLARAIEAAELAGRFDGGGIRNSQSSQYRSERVGAL